MRESSSNLSDTGKLIGRVFDNRYQIVELIGRGGMSAVYKGIQLSMGKTVAIKVMARSLAEDDRLLQRFNQEALACSRLRHPNTIKVFDYGQSDDGHLFLAMELLEGRTLGQVIRTDSPMSPLRTCRIARQVCKSLAEAHRGGIVHRDLKPDNVFLSDIYGEKDFVKVLDFGIAKFITEGSQETLTQTGFICGTPLYLSPEQGLARSLDHRTDLYSLGIILYEMLTGITPFRADTPIGVVMKHIHEPVPPFQVMNPGARIPGGLESLVLQLLEKEPERRPPSADEVGAILDELMSSPDLPRAPRAAPPPPPSRGGPPPPPNHTMLASPPRVAGRVLSMHMNERPTMFLPADQVPPPNLLREPEDITERGSRTEALPEPVWEQEQHDDDGDDVTVEWHDRTMLLSPDELPDEDPDRTEFLPVLTEGPPPVDATRLLPAEELAGVEEQDMTTGGVPSEERPPARWGWAVAAVLLLAVGAVIYFATDWLRGSSSTEKPGAAVAEAGGQGDHASDAPGAAVSSAESREAAPAGSSAHERAPGAAAKAEPTIEAHAAVVGAARPVAGPGGAPEEAPPTAPAPAAPLDATPEAGASAAAVAPTAPTDDSLTVMLTTVPPGAEVIDGIELRGRTPLSVAVPRHGVARSLRIRLEGHKEEVVLVDPMLVRSGAQIEVKLAATEPTGAPAAQPAAAPASDGSKSAGKGATEGAAAAPGADTPKKKQPKKTPKAPATPKGGKKPSGKPKGGGDMDWKDW